MDSRRVETDRDGLDRDKQDETAQLQASRKRAWRPAIPPCYQGRVISIPLQQHGVLEKEEREGKKTPMRAEH